MPANTPISRSKSAALTRVLDAVPKGYTLWTSGTVAAAKAERLARKFHWLYGIGCTPAQRITQRKHKHPNALLAMYWPEGAEKVEWILLATNRKGDLAIEGEKMHDVAKKPRLVWLGYEFIRHSANGKTIWTWKRTKSEMSEHYTLMAELSNKKYEGSIKDFLQRLANQPGFHGVRAQTFELFSEAKRRGYKGEYPHIFFMQRISHGDRLLL